MKFWNVSRIKASKGQKRLPCVTVFDYTSARLADEAGIPLMLVGDSLGQGVLGYPSTLPVTMADMLHHTRAVMRGVSSALVVADMPFLSYQISVEEGLRNAGRFVQEAGADGVKVEGGAARVELVEALVGNGIPVLGHIGLTPQSCNVLGGYKVQGRTREAADRLIEDAMSLSQAGIFALVLECVPPDVAASITAAIPVPVIGIGAGPACDGQIMVLHDLLGLTDGAPPKFVKKYAALSETIGEAFTKYMEEVREGGYPSQEHTY